MTSRFSKKRFYLLLAFLMLFCFSISHKAVAEKYSSHVRGFYCSELDTCGATAYDAHSWGSDNINVIMETYNCGSWQICESEAMSYMQCSCNVKCLDLPANPRYFNEPVNRAGQKDVNQAGQENANSVNLPVVFTWNNIPGWTVKSASKITKWENLKDGKYTIRHMYGDGGVETHLEDTSFTNKGPKSYRIQIQDDSISGINNLNLNPNQKNNLSRNEGTETVDGKLAFYKVLNINAFNSRDDGGECFFNNNSAYKWRLKSCCDENGTVCTDVTGWWQFKTSAAPEPLGIIDKNHQAASPEQDPDWNGSGHLKNVDYCSARLSWCKAKLVDGDDRFSKKYNTSQFNYATDYQMRVKFSENWSLNIFSGSSGTASSWQSILMDKLLNSPIAQSLNYLYTQAVKITSEEKQDGESCHYLEKQQDGSCKPETVPFDISEINNPSNPNFRPFFAAAERKNQNRSLFTGDMSGNLIYSWQTKVCFNVVTGKAGDADFPFCNAYNDKNYGQKWKFAGAAVSGTKINPPERQSPSNNTTRDTNNLVGLSDAIQWSIPCGANSFLYDIQEVGGRSIFSSDTSYPKDGGRRITASRLSITLTDKTPAQGSDPQIVDLKINKYYQWRVRSCWPSLPIGEISSICSDWSTPLSFFYTTGRPPKDNSLKTLDNAPKIDFEWESVSGAKSYRIKIVGAGAPKDDSVTTANQFSFVYPGSKKPYIWQVKTCADAGGIICGNWSASMPFNSGDFIEPTNLAPAGENKQLPFELSWNSNAKYFLVNATFTGKTDSSCDPSWFNSEYKDKKVTGTSTELKTMASGGSRSCPGVYWFKVQPCFDANCKSLSNISSDQDFTVIDPEQTKTGLMVCGQATNPVETPYNEKEPCEIRHLVLILKVIIDFITFKVAFMLLPILMLITGYFFYTSDGNPETIETMKDSWKKIGIGYGFLIFAWMIVSILMMIAGYGAIWWQVL